MLLEGIVVVVTGAGGGLGEGIARVCYREAASVVVADIRGEAARQVAGSLGTRAHAVECDVTNDSHLDGLIEAALNRFGRVDGLVNNAGVNFSKPFFDTTPEDWDRVIKVDLRAVFFLTQKVCEQMTKQSPLGGSIVNIASVHTHATLPGSGPYDAAKWGVVGLGKSIAVELASQNIRINTVSPGLLNTRIWKDIQAAAPDTKRCLEYWKSNIPIERIIEPEEIAELVAFLLSNRAAALTGANIMADGGMCSQLVSRAPYSSRPITG